MAGCGRAFVVNWFWEAHILLKICDAFRTRIMMFLRFLFFTQTGSVLIWPSDDGALADIVHPAGKVWHAAQV